MKSRLIWFLGWIVLLFIAGIYSGEKIFFVGLFILLSLMIYSALSSLWVLLDFKYLQTVTPTTATKGQKAVLQMEIHNDKPFIFPFIKVYFLTPEDTMAGTQQETVFSILPFQHQELKKEFICNLRGKFPLGITRIEVRDLFGLFTFSMDLHNKIYHKPLSLNVNPRVLKLADLPLPQIQQEGSLNQLLLSTEEAASISDIRQYRYGDPLQKIHWKLSSKLQEIYVKNYETTSQPEVLLFVETSPYPAEGMTRYQVEDQVVECAAAVSQYILSRWLSLNLITYDHERHRVNGKKPYDFEHFFSFLAELPFNSSFSMSEILMMESMGFTRGGSIVLIIHQLTPTLYNHLCIYKQSGLDVMVFLVRPRIGNNIEPLRILGELNDKGINSFVIYDDERLDAVMEASLS